MIPANAVDDFNFRMILIVHITAHCPSVDHSSLEVICKLNRIASTLYDDRGSGPSLPAKKFFFGRKTTFSEAQKTPKKQTDAEQREPFFRPR
jgi:hypothetical protein